MLFQLGHVDTQSRIKFKNFHRCSNTSKGVGPRAIRTRLMVLAICTVFKNEAPYLREWIEFHRLVGFEEFYLYENCSDDAWESVLGPYVKADIVRVAHWPLRPPCQLQAFQHFSRFHARRDMLVAFIDCDEFLFSPRCETVMEALVQLPQFAKCGAVGVNWLCFGSSGLETKGDGLVIERFQTRPTETFQHNAHIKSIVRMDRLVSFTGDAHHFGVIGGTLSELGERVDSAFTSRPSHAVLRINHYVTKSREEYDARVSCGRVDLSSPRHNDFEMYQKERIEDKVIARFLPLLRERLGRPVS